MRRGWAEGLLHVRERRLERRGAQRGGLGTQLGRGGMRAVRLLEARVCEQQRQVLLEGGAWLGPGFG